MNVRLPLLIFSGFIVYGCAPPHAYRPYAVVKHEVVSNTPFAACCCCDGKFRPGLDADDDGRATAGEIQAFLEKAFDATAEHLGFDAKGGVTRERFVADRNEKFAAILPRFDLNGDAMITREEFFGGGAEKFGRIALDMDTNKDRSVNAEEAAAHERAEFDGLLAKLDADKNGVIGRDEFVTGFASEMATADTNKDGALSREEFRRRAAAAGSQGSAVPRGFIPDGPGMICLPDHTHCIGIFIPGAFGSGTTVNSRGTCISDPWHPDYDWMAPCENFPWS
jgi:Ca2+-binding EF-hand superfamily protein